jgi:hypothetical protein
LRPGDSGFDQIVEVASPLVADDRRPVGRAPITRLELSGGGIAIRGLTVEPRIRITYADQSQTIVDGGMLVATLNKLKNDHRSVLSLTCMVIGVLFTVCGKSSKQIAAVLMWTTGRRE